MPDEMQEEHKTPEPSVREALGLSSMDYGHGPFGR